MSSSSDDSDDSLQDVTEFSSHRRKRQRTGASAREKAALGVFGSDSEEDGAPARWKQKTLRTKGLGFVKSEGPGEGEVNGEQEDQDAEMKDGSESESESDPGLDDTFSGRGLGFTVQPKRTGVSVSSPLGTGFTPSSAKYAPVNFAPPTEATPPPARKLGPSFMAEEPQSNGRRRNEPAKPKINQNSFAARMMAKMGYVEGQGLGATGQGRLTPVEGNVRPQGVGLGAVSEMSKADKQEARRLARLRGEPVEESSDEEKKRKAKKAAQRGSQPGSGASTPRSSKPKVRYRTTAEIEKAAEGLHVPSVLKSIIDVTGKETKLLTSASGLLTPSSEQPLVVSEGEKIARRARRELEAFADEWRSLMERKKYFDAQARQLDAEIQKEQESIRRMNLLTDAVRDLDVLDTAQSSLSDDDVRNQSWNKTVTVLESLELQFQHELAQYHLAEVAVAAVHPLFRAEMGSWSPPEESMCVHHLQRLRNILGVPLGSSTALAIDNEERRRLKPRKSTTPYESMIYSLWLPKIRSFVNNEWNVHDASPAIALIESWKDLLPDFILENVLEQLIVHKLTAAIGSWNPKSTRKSSSAEPPHVWLFPWFQYLSAEHTDPKASHGLLSEVKRRFKRLLDSWELSRGVFVGLSSWQDVLGGELEKILIRHLLPRLGRLLRDTLDIDPADQKMEPLERVFQWKDFFRPHIIAELLVMEFFPKWHETLHIWLTNEPDFGEIEEWFTWWKEQIPSEINAVRSMAQQWEKGFEMINTALDLGDEVKEKLPQPVKPSHKPKPTKPTKEVPVALPPKPAAVLEETSFRQIVEDWCADENLLFMPLREAHETTGAPLFRITASASGKGGVIVYLRGDIVWAQQKGNRANYEPVGLGSVLADRAEGK